MLLLGVSGGHDSNWALVNDCGIIGAFEKERFTRKRHDGGEVMALVANTLKMLGLSAKDVDLVATSEPVHRNTDPGLRLLMGRKYRRADEWSHQVVECFGRVLPCVSIAHHLCHAAYAVYTSGFRDCVAVTLDGGGDFYTEEAYTAATVSIWKAGRFEYLEPIANVDFGSLWYTYAHSVFGDAHQAGKLMGLAGYGSGVLTEQFYYRFTAPVQGPFAGCRAVKNCWPDHFDPPFMEGIVSWESPQAREVACAVQEVTTRAGLELVSRVRTVTGMNQLVLSGGVALNGYLNTAIATSGLFNAVYVPPAVHDGGLALGAALFCKHHLLGQAPAKSDPCDIAALGHAYPVPPDPSDDLGAAASRLNRAEAVHRCADALAQGKIVAIYTGRSEHGPRALGQRSILAAPNAPRMRDRINRNIKYREHFRPLSPVTLALTAAQYFDISWDSPYMMYIVGCSDRTKRDAFGVCHVDGTARVQTVVESSFLGQILQEFNELAGIPILINTSLNVQQPIVETPVEAAEVFRNVPLDAIWLEGWWAERCKR
jgi:carbamoyltransferase